MQKHIKPLLSIFLFSIFYSLFSEYSIADTIHTNDGKELKGIVVEDYNDRIILSTVDGEVAVMKSDIKELYFDGEEDNLIKLAELAKERRDYTRAFVYYDMALKLNPNSKSAKDGLVFLQGYLFRQEQARKEGEVRKQEELERQSGIIATQKSGEEEFEELAPKLKRTVGITLELNRALPQVTWVQMNSPAYEVGVKRGDLLVAIWGRLTGYMSLEEVIDLLLEKSSMEIKCTIERTIDINANGASFSMEFDGLTVSGVKEASAAFESGLRQGDLIVAIDGKPTRYMPLKNALELVNNQEGKSIRLTLRREMLIWRRQ